METKIWVKVISTILQYMHDFLFNFLVKIPFLSCQIQYKSQTESSYKSKQQLLYTIDLDEFNSYCYILC